MSDTPSRGVLLARAALSMVGTPFLLHGRDPAIGLDCVGVVAASLKAIDARPVPPEGYSLRNSAPESWFGHAALSGLVAMDPLRDTPVRPGDILATRPGPAQVHLQIATSAHSAVHAHAGLRRVVHQPLSAERVVLARWRLP